MFSFNQDMPKVVEPALKIFKHFKNPEWTEITNMILKKDGSIRATKPKVSKDKPVTGKAAYVWRMLVFYVSPRGQHRCMPMTADFDLPAYNEAGEWKSDISRAMAKELDVLVDCIMETIPKNQHHGVHAWGKALGYINE